jgi:hypothetical protein
MEDNMIRVMLVIGTFLAVSTLGTVARAQDDDSSGGGNVDLSVPYTPHQETDDERLQNFQTPPPAPPQDSVLNRAANMYENAPVRPSYDAQMKAPIVQYQQRY